MNELQLFYFCSVKHKDNVSRFLVKNTSSSAAVCRLTLLHDRKKYFEFQPSQFIVEVYVLDRRLTISF
jgi:hypothetical protein